MIFIFFKVSLVIVLSIIAFQDFKERMVWLFLFPCFAFLGGYLHFETTMPEVFYYNSLINLLFIAVIFLCCFLYSRILLKKKFINGVMGLGDIYFLIGFAISFPLITFLTLFFFSILFTSLIHALPKIIIKRNEKDVPLAGAMSIFLLNVYLIHWVGLYKSLYFI